VTEETLLVFHPQQSSSTSSSSFKFSQMPHLREKLWKWSKDNALWVTFVSKKNNYQMSLHQQSLQEMQKLLL
jgi:hypothetical protein